MEYREAIERLRDHFSVHNDDRYTPKLDEAKSLAYAAMRKQIPMCPEMRQDEHGNDWLACPDCESFLGYSVDWENECYQSNYCDFCGQEIDWK